MAPSLTLSQYAPVTQFESLQLPDKCQAVQLIESIEWLSVSSTEYRVLSTVIHMHMSATF